MRAHIALVALLLLPGCAHWLGPAHGLVEVAGSTPADEACELSLAPVGASGSTSRQVAGPFRETFMISHSRGGHRAQLSCGGSIVSTRTFKYGRDVQIGGELLLTGDAP